MQSVNEKLQKKLKLLKLKAVRKSGQFLVAYESGPLNEIDYKNAVPWPETNKS